MTFYRRPRSSFTVPLLAFLLLLAGSCIKDRFVPLPDYTEGNLDNTLSIPQAYDSLFEGVYELRDGYSAFGVQLVAKWKQGALCFFGEHDGRYINLRVGFDPADSSIRMGGIWRSPIGEEQGILELTIAKDEGSTALWSGHNKGMILRGDVDGKGIVIAYKRPFSDAVRNRSFALLAHRGGGRNSDNLPYAENSLSLVKFAEKMGATGIEIDIRLTKDNIPVIYHDADINTRLTRKSPLVGAIRQYSFDFLRAYIQLVDGQPIPTLKEMLATAIDSTRLQYIWLDCKDGGEDNFFRTVIPVAQQAISDAAAKNRKVAIFFGLPTDDAFARFLAYPGHEQLPSLCELSLEKTFRAGSRIFAPRWTLGILTDDTETAHASGISVFTWTLDDATGINDVITKSRYDGILSNYPSILAYKFYSQE